VFISLLSTDATIEEAKIDEANIDEATIALGIT